MTNEKRLEILLSDYSNARGIYTSLVLKNPNHLSDDSARDERDVHIKLWQQRKDFLKHEVDIARWYVDNSVNRDSASGSVWYKSHRKVAS